ncbi:hypothetical protein BH10PSE14_BH10PSE14_06560 [soil metagenome]
MSDVDIPPSTSIKVRIVSFVRAFMLAHEVSPSLNEIALHVGSTKPRVSRALDELVAAGRLLRRKRCARGLSFPGDLDRALTTLRREGWIVDDDMRVLSPPRVTK